MLLEICKEGGNLSVAYDVFLSAFLLKAKAYNILQNEESLATQVLDSYMKTAISRFNSACSYNLLNFNDDIREIEEDIEQSDLDEIVDIVSEGMVVCWLQPFINNSDNLVNILNTADYTAYSPANLTKANYEIYKESKSEFRKLVKNYTYSHGDLTELHI